MATNGKVLDFFKKNAAFYSMFLQNIDQKRIVSRYLSMKIMRAKLGCRRVLCVGGGSGEGDLEVLARLPRKNLEIDYLDPSAQMRGKFLRRAKLLGLSGNIRNVWTERFESRNLKDEYDLVLCINVVYFLDWQAKAGANALEKIYGCLKENGTAVIVVRSAESSHTAIKRIAGGGKTTGETIRKKLKELGIPHYAETVASSINLSSCFKNGEFNPGKNGNRLLSFMFGDRWNGLSAQRRKKVISAIAEKTTTANGLRTLEAMHEYIWVYKHSTKTATGQADGNPQALGLARRIRKAINSVPDFPVKGMVFRDTTPLMRNAALFRDIIGYAKKKYSGYGIDYVIAKDMQGLVWAGAIANALGCGVVPMFRKDLAGEVITACYEHEYNPQRVVNLQKHAIRKGSRVLLVDYILATGETMRVMSRMAEHSGGRIAGIFAIVELESLNARRGLGKYDLHTLVKY